MPGSGLNITLDFQGGNATQFEQHSSTLASILAEHLRLDASDVFVCSVSGRVAPLSR